MLDEDLHLWLWLVMIPQEQGCHFRLWKLTIHPLWAVLAHRLLITTLSRMPLQRPHRLHTLGSQAVPHSLVLLRLHLLGLSRGLVRLLDVVCQIATPSLDHLVKYRHHTCLLCNHLPPLHSRHKVAPTEVQWFRPSLDREESRMQMRTGEDGPGIQEHTLDLDLLLVGSATIKHPMLIDLPTHRNPLHRRPGFPESKASTMHLLHRLCRALRRVLRTLTHHNAP